MTERNIVGVHISPDIVTEMENCDENTFKRDREYPKTKYKYPGERQRVKQPNRINSLKTKDCRDQMFLLLLFDDDMCDSALHDGLKEQHYVRLRIIKRNTWQQLLLQLITVLFDVSSQFLKVFKEYSAAVVWDDYFYCLETSIHHFKQRNGW